MATPPDLRTANIRLTFQRALGETLSVDTVGADGMPFILQVPIHHEDPYADPDSMGAPSSPPARAWVSLAWIQDGAGRRSTSIVQLDVYCRLGPKDSPEADPFGIIASDIADAVEAIFSGARPDGTFRGWIPILDFSSDPLNPVPADNCIFIYNPGSGASWGQPIERTNLPISGGYRRITLRYAMRLTTDATSDLPPMHA